MPISQYNCSGEDDFELLIALPRELHAPHHSFGEHDDVGGVLIDAQEACDLLAMLPHSPQNTSSTLSFFTLSQLSLHPQDPCGICPTTRRFPASVGCIKKHNTDAHRTISVILGRYGALQVYASITDRST